MKAGFNTRWISGLLTGLLGVMLAVPDGVALAQRSVSRSAADSKVASRAEESRAPARPLTGALTAEVSRPVSPDAAGVKRAAVSRAERGITRSAAEPTSGAGVSRSMPRGSSTAQKSDEKSESDGRRGDVAPPDAARSARGVSRETGRQSSGSGRTEDSRARGDRTRASGAAEHAASSDERRHRPPWHSNARAQRRAYPRHRPVYRHGVWYYVHPSSHIHVGVAWPWRTRFSSVWRPRLTFSQTVYVGPRYARAVRSRVDLRTYLSQRVLYADDFRAEIEIEIEAIDFFDHGRYLGTVDRIPHHLRTVRAEIRSDGTVFFDRNLYVVGTPHTGFELVSTRYYGEPVYRAYQASDGIRVGRVSLSSGSVTTRAYSRFFGKRPFVPVSLLPDDDRLWAYGYEAGSVAPVRIDRREWSELPAESVALYGDLPDQGTAFTAVRRHEEAVEFGANDELDMVRISEVGFAQ